jgi:hypothetical protein
MAVRYICSAPEVDERAAALMLEPRDDATVVGADHGIGFQASRIWRASLPRLRPENESDLARALMAAAVGERRKTLVRIRTRV